MSLVQPVSRRVTAIVVAVVAIVSGLASAYAGEPIMQYLEQTRIGADNLFGLLGPFSLSAGLFFGLLGGAVLWWVQGQSWVRAGVFLLTSMIGMAAAVYLAMLSFENTSDSFVIPYLVGSPVGALIVGVPLAFMASYTHPWRCIGLATGLSTLWALLVALVVDADAALSPQGLAALYVGWHAIVLGTFALSPRRA